MKYLFLIIFTIIITCCESKKNQPSKLSNNRVEENFEIFLNKFSSDSIFQIQRVKFPLLSKTDDRESGQRDQSIIQQKDWIFSNFTKLKTIPKYVISHKKINTNEYHLIFQIEDTGVNVTYVFKNEQGNWFLILINDDSD